MTVEYLNQGGYDSLYNSHQSPGAGATYQRTPQPSVLETFSTDKNWLNETFGGLKLGFFTQFHQIKIYKT